MPQATADLFTNPGTHAAAYRPVPAYTVVSAVPFSGVRDSGFTGMGIRVDETDRTATQYVMALLYHLLQSGTHPAIWGEPQPASRSQDLAAAVQELHARSGLTWQELADTLGVSRRAVHQWVSGGRVSAPRAKRVEELARLIARHEAGDPNTTRARLRAPARDGRSALSRFQAESRPRQSVPLSTLSVMDLLTDEPLVEPPQEVAPDRQSRLSPRRLG